MRSPLAKPTAFAVQKPRFASLDVDECARCPAISGECLPKQSQQTRYPPIAIARRLRLRAVEGLVIAKALAHARQRRMLV